MPARRPAEAGFTMIELVVACVLIGLVLFVAAGTIMRGFSGAAETATSASGRAKAAEAAERLGADVRGARSTGRDGAKIVDVADLAEAVREDDAGRVGQLYDIEGNLLDWRDVTDARPNQLTFQSDVVDETAGGSSMPECVTWQVANTADGWYLQRITRAYADRCAGGGGAVRENDPITQPTRSTPAPGTGGTPPLFTYVIAQRTGNGCQSRVRSGPLRPAERNRVLGVRIDFSSLVVYRDDASRSTLRDEIAIRSRSAADYQLALGCDEG